LSDAADSRKPNVLFLSADDLCTALGCYGHPLVKSPNIDALAARGVKFERAYCQFPLCSPSRTSFLTGRRPNVTQIFTNPSAAYATGAKTFYSVHFRTTLPDTITMPQLFRQHGYFVTRIGKLFHYGVPADIGTASFDDYRSWDYTINPRGRDKDDEDEITTLTPKAQGAGRFGATLSWLAAKGADEEQTDGIAATEAIAMLEKLKKRNQPFFLAVGFYRPHTPYVAPKKYFDLYPLDKVQPGKLEPGEKEKAPAPAYASGKPEQDKMTDQQRRQAAQAYHASTSFMDAQVGRVLGALKRLDLERDTVVVFTSDHGYHLGEHGLWQKMSIWDESARVPLVIAAPGAKGSGKTAKSPVELVDLYPTLADLCGLTAPEYLDGKSLRPMLDDPAKSVKPAALTQVARGNFHGLSVRTERWHYIAWDYGDKGAQLYDHTADAHELTNLADDPKHAATVAEMKQLVLKNWPKDGWPPAEPATQPAAKRTKKKE
jgi:uncharacterized sulfatase